ncbi:ABC transporter substrate-binding protein [Erwinia sp. CPCC 100877]|nr:ABC transporter substrate-binding protein [Erwinia sp. CPCC 100877]
MKKRHIWFGVFGLMLVVTVGCSNTNKTAVNDSASRSEVQKSTDKKQEETRTFVDSAGRKVEVPKTITKIAPSGSLAQIVLYTSFPDNLVGLAGSFSESAKEFIPEKYQQLPEFGQFYGKNASLNMEALSAAQPEVIIDIGEAKKTVKEDMDQLQEQIDIPTVFVEANLENLPEAYNTLGELLGNKAETAQLAKYCQKVIDQAKKVRASIKEADQKSVYYASGKAGLNTNSEGSFHAQVIDEVGAKNAVTGMKAASQGGGTVVSIEQLIQWQPDYILADSADIYDLIKTDPSWQELAAVKKGHVYQVPTAPYNFMDFPPSVNRIMGIQWLGQLLYPDQYNLKITEEIKEFYQLFYHSSVTDEQIKQILHNAE